MDILDKLKSQIGDDVRHVFDSEVLYRLAIEEIEKLREENQRLKKRWIRPGIKAKE